MLLDEDHGELDRFAGETRMAAADIMGLGCAGFEMKSPGRQGQVLRTLQGRPGASLRRAFTGRSARQSTAAVECPNCNTQAVMTRVTLRCCGAMLAALRRAWISVVRGLGKAPRKQRAMRLLARCRSP